MLVLNLFNFCGDFQVVIIFWKVNIENVFQGNVPCCIFVPIDKFFTNWTHREQVRPVHILLLFEISTTPSRRWKASFQISNNRHSATLLFSSIDRLERLESAMTHLWRIPLVNVLDFYISSFSCNLGYFFKKLVGGRKLLSYSLNGKLCVAAGNS